jgi:hypothetical protein
VCVCVCVCGGGRIILKGAIQKYNARSGKVMIFFFKIGETQNVLADLLSCHWKVILLLGLGHSR